jgi:hypothetical protein
MSVYFYQLWTFHEVNMLYMDLLELYWQRTMNLLWLYWPWTSFSVNIILTGPYITYWPREKSIIDKNKLTLNRQCMTHISPPASLSGLIWAFRANTRSIWKMSCNNLWLLTLKKSGFKNIPNNADLYNDIRNCL